MIFIVDICVAVFTASMKISGNIIIKHLIYTTDSLTNIISITFYICFLVDSCVTYMT